MAGIVTARRFIVSGKVQGVFFRASTARFAEMHNLRGFAKNLPDGRVEVLALGDTASLDMLADWLQRGPPRAEVTGVTRQDEDVELHPGIAGFRTG